MMRRFALILVVTLACSATAFAQNHTDVVAAVKAELQAHGQDLAGPCGAFQITKRVAWRLRSDGAGLLSKPGGNNCDGYSVDYVTYPDGSGVDILGDAGGANSPGWDLGEVPGALSGRWRAPFDPGDSVVVVPPVVVLPPPVTQPATDLLAQIAALRLELATHEAAEHLERDQAEAFRQSVADKWKHFGVFLAKYAPMVVGAIYAGRATAK